MLVGCLAQINMAENKMSLHFQNDKSSVYRGTFQAKLSWLQIIFEISTPPAFSGRPLTDFSQCQQESILNIPIFLLVTCFLTGSASWHCCPCCYCCCCADSHRSAESLNSSALMTRRVGTLLDVSLCSTTSLFIQQVLSPPGQFMMPGVVYFTDSNLIIFLPLSPELFRWITLV